MKRMWTLEELIALIQQEAPGFDPSSIESGTIAASSILGLDGDGGLVKGNLFGQYAKVITLSDGTYNALDVTLSEAFYNEIKDGCFINGDFMGVHNPVVFPEYEMSGEPSGFVLLGKPILPTDNPWNAYFVGWCIYTASLVGTGTRFKRPRGPVLCVNYSGRVTISGGESNGVSLLDITVLNGKNFPQYPADADTKTYALQLVNGTLTWVDITPAP